MKLNYLLMGILLIFSFSFISAEEIFGYNYLEGQLNKPQGINNTVISINDSEYWDGNPWSDTRWLNIDGSNANQNIDISSYDFTTTGSGFFNFLGSSISRITKGWFTDLDISNNLTVGGNITTNVLFGDVKIDTINGQTYNYLQDWIDTTQSAGRVSGGEFTSNGDGTVNVSRGSGFIKTSNDPLANTILFDWEENISVNLIDQDTNYIYVDYNSGNPIVSSSLIKVNNRDKILLGKIFREGNVLHLFEAGMYIAEATKNSVSRQTSINGEFTRANGLILSEVSNLDFSMTSGIAWGGNNRIEVPSYNSNITEFEYYYFDGSSWLEYEATEINNTKYNNIASGLEDLIVNRYGVHWVYVCNDGHILVVYGQDSYTLANAIESQPPGDLPNHVVDFGEFIGRVIVQEGETSFYSVDIPSDFLFTSGGATDYNSLANLPDLSIYVPYTGATSNLDLGNYNFSVGTSDFFVNNNLGRVGIGTTSPEDPLHIAGAGKTYIRIESTDGNAAGFYLESSGSQTWRPGVENADLYSVYDVTNNQLPFRIEPNTPTNTLYLDSTGNVGIGTDSPSGKLDVTGEVNIHSAAPVLSLRTDAGFVARLGDLGAGTDGQLLLYDAAGGNLNVLFSGDGSNYILNNNVGIGTTGPVANLEIRDNTNANTNRLLYVIQNPVTTEASINMAEFRGETSDYTIRMNNAGTGEALYISSGELHVVENVGIGTTSPQEKLDLNGLQIIRAGDNTQALQIRNTANNNAFLFGVDSTGDGFLNINDNAGATKILLDADTNSYINNGANFGIGIASPISKTHIYENNAVTSTSGGLTIENDGTGDAQLQFLITGLRRMTMGIDQSDSNKFKISGSADVGVTPFVTIDDNSGNFGIGTTVPISKLHVNSGATNRASIFESTDAGAYVSFEDDSTTDGKVLIGALGDDLKFLTDATTRMTIKTSTGNVGIKVEDPHSALEVNGAISSETLLFSTTGPTDNIDVSGVNTLFADTGSNSVTIGGFTGGVVGQVLYIAKVNGANNLILEHSEGIGNEQMFLVDATDITFSNYGGVTLVFNGAHWFQAGN